LQTVVHPGTGRMAVRLLAMDQRVAVSSSGASRLDLPRRDDGAESVDLGVSAEITSRDLVELIARLTGFTGEIR
jgi:hypothetical protein